MRPKTPRLGAVLLALLIVVGGAAAYTTIFTAASGTTYETDSGLVVETTTDHGLDDANPFNDTDTVYVDGVAFSAAGPANVAVDRFSGTWTNLSAIEAASNNITVNPDDKSSVEIAGDVTALSWQDAALDGTAQLTYSASGSGSVTLSGFPADTDYAAATTGGTVLTVGTTTSNGEAIIQVESATDEDVVLLEPSGSTFGAASPTGGEDFNDENIEMSIQINDTDFGTAAGDSVTVDFYVDGGQTDSITITSNQTVTFDATGLSDGSHTWHVETNDSYGVTSSSSTFSIDVNHYAPVIDNGSASPAGALSASNLSFIIDITDRDFEESSGDTVTAELFVDGSKVGEDTLTSNGTASVDYTIPTGGDHTYHWVATDEYGKTTTSQTFDVSTPSELRIYNESAPTQLVDNATVELRMYANETGTEQIYERNTSDGTINMTGLPANQPFVVVAQAENYTTRRIFVESLYDQQSIYLLPESEPTVDTIFAIEDYTGDFPKENTVLIVQRALNGSYQTVLGDFFGASGQFPAQLAYNERHRLIVKNTETGETRPVGTYTPITSTTQNIIVTPEGIERFEGEPPKVLIKPQAKQLPAVNDAELSVTVQNGTDSIDSWSVTAQVVNGSTSSTVWTHSAGASGTATKTLDLTGEAGNTLNVSVTYTVGGTTLTEYYDIQVTETYGPDNTLLGAIASLANLSPDGARSSFTTFLAMLITVFVVAGTATIQPSGELAGLVGVFVLTGFSLIGWVGYDLVFISAVGLMSVGAIRRGL